VAQRSRRSGLFILLAIVLVLAAVAAWLWLRKPVGPATTTALHLTPASYADLPGWSSADLSAALAAFKRSCGDLAKKNPTALMGGAGYAGTVGDWLEACRAAPQSGSEARRFFEAMFTPVAVNKDTDDGLFTGYYEPELHLSHTQHGAFQTPIYGVPDDLITVDLGLFKDSLKGEHVTGRVQGTTLIPYADRAEINRKGLPHAQVLAWSDDPVSVFFLHIQGSGRAAFDDGSAGRIAYAGQNGRPYTPIGRTLIREGAMQKADLSMQGIRIWLKAHPDQAQRIMETDASFVFFDEEPLGDAALGANGSEGVPLTPGASLAVDQHVHALGVPLWLSLDEHSTALPRNRLMIAQDTGGAIKGAVRGDVYFGFGEKPEWNAGHMKAAGAMFVLLPKDLARKLPAEFRP
jgi:membrane-bound lytic murein transglycosylase A